jgi:hypothetical protein
MAPNRKNVASLLESLSSNDLQNLQSTIQPKFLPLTDAREAEQHQQPQQQQVKAVESVSYWDWDANVVEEPVDVLSTANIASNLIQAAATVVSESQPVAAHDDYWADQSQPVVVVNKPQHVECSYWEWPAEQDSKKATIDRILAEERAFHLVSAAATEETERSASPVFLLRQVQSHKESNDQYWAWESNQVASHTMDASHPNANYWDWEEKTEEHPFQALLEYEAVRQMLTAENIVRQMQWTKVQECATQNKSDDYWTWSEHYGDQYWEAPKSQAVSTGYWDM